MVLGYLMKMCMYGLWLMRKEARLLRQLRVCSWRGEKQEQMLSDLRCNDCESLSEANGASFVMILLRKVY